MTQDPCRYDDISYLRHPEFNDDGKNNWDNYSDMELAEMWFNKEGIDTVMIKTDGEWALMVKPILSYLNGERLNLVLHPRELEERANQWRYENE